MLFNSLETFEDRKWGIRKSGKQKSAKHYTENYRWRKTRNTEAGDKYSRNGYQKAFIQINYLPNIQIYLKPVP